MKRLLVAIAIIIPLAVGGCAGTPAGEIIRAATGTFVNPVGQINIYQVKEGYAAVLEVADGWRDYCWPTSPFKSYADLMKDPISRTLCQNRRNTLRIINAADDKAFDALTRAEKFIIANPTVNAAAIVSEAWAAVQDFKRVASNTAIAIAPK